jgi:hypothetical protein
VLCGRREPCSQLCTAFGLTQTSNANFIIQQALRGSHDWEFFEALSQ